MLLFIKIFGVLTLTIPADQVVLILVPVLTWLATGLLNKIKAWGDGQGFGGLILTGVLVPALSLIAGIIADSMNILNQTWLELFFLGLAGTFVNELLKQARQTFAKVQTKATSKLIG